MARQFYNWIVKYSNGIGRIHRIWIQGLTKEEIEYSFKIEYPNLKLISITSLSEADSQFIQKFNIDPRKNNNI